MTIVVDPNVAENAVALILRPNLPDAVDQPLLNGSGAGPGIHLMPEFQFPFVVNEHGWAESAATEGRRRTRTRPTNPSGGGEVRIEGGDQAEFWSYHDSFQQTIAAINRTLAGRPVGGELEVTLSGGQTITFDLDSADLAEPTNLDRLVAIRHAIFGFAFECASYGRLAPVELLDAPVVSSDRVVSVPIPEVPGQVEALLDITLTDSEGQSRSHAEYGIEENVDLDDLPPLAIEAADLVELGGSLSGAVITAGLTSTALAICSTGPQDHQGARRVKVDVTADTDETFIRLEWRVGDGPWKPERWHRCLTGAECERDLGVIAIPAGETWEGRIVGYCAAGGQIDVKRVVPFPAARYAKVRRPFDISTPTTFLAHDPFDHTSGDLGDKTAPGGGGWDEAGDADGLTINTTDGTARRTSVSDADLDTGAFAFVGPALTDCAAQVEISFSAYLASGLVGTRRYGLLLRYVDDDNCLFAVLTNASGPDSSRGRLALYKRVGGADSELVAMTSGSPFFEVPDATYLLRATVLANGNYGVAARLNGSPLGAGLPLLGTDTDLATGGDLESGQAGIYDAQTDATANTRDYDNFALWDPEPDAVLFANESMRFGARKAERESSTGTGWGKIAEFEGELPRLAPSGREQLAHRLAIKADRNDADKMPLGGVGDELTVESVLATPRVLLSSRVS